MNDNDKMRAEFESWASEQCLSLTRINWDDGTVSEYAYTATFDAWQVWQAAFAAGRKAEQKEQDFERLLVEALKEELAAEKAASVVPVGITDLALCGGGQRIEFYIEGDKSAGAKMLAWLRERMKERGEG